MNSFPPTSHEVDGRAPPPTRPAKKVRASARAFCHPTLAGHSHRKHYGLALAGQGLEKLILGLGRSLVASHDIYIYSVLPAVFRGDGYSFGLATPVANDGRIEAGWDLTNGGAVPINI